MLRGYLKGHQVATAAQQGWDRLWNGDLLKLTEDAGFAVLVTTDKNMRYQQNLSTRAIAIVVLGRGKWPLIEARVQYVVADVDDAVSGSYVELEIPFE